MAEARQASLSELAKYGFVELSSTMAKLDELVRAVGDPARSAIAQLARSADPDQALNGLLSLAEVNRSQTKKLLSRADSSLRLCLVLGSSSALTDFLRRHPESLSLFEKSISQLATPAEFNAVLIKSSIEPLSKADPADPASVSAAVLAAWNALRIAYRCELLKISIFDLSQTDVEVGVPVVAAALADIAGAAIEAALAIARWELVHSREFGHFEADEVAATRFSVMAMGKCGARELNYISDVDVIFVAESGSADVSNQRAIEIGTRIAGRMMRAIDGTATEPMLWQVDANLRPEGKSGALVRTLDSHVSYYERWAESWEFQALLKARPLAGDLGLGEAYVDALAPLVWNSAKRENFVESVQKMRQRVLDNIPRAEIDLQIKLGPGGLRDIEFTVQLLQLVHGRADDSLRQRDTIGAINSLAAGGYIGRGEATQFAAHYRYLRLLEHRIQMSNMRRTHLMPTSEAARRALARAINVKDTVETLERRWNNTKLEVRSLHQKLFFRPLLAAVARSSDDALAITSEQASDRLRAIGFQDAAGALNHIGALTNGLSRRAAIQKQLLPVLIQWFAEGTDPDAALLAFRRLSEDLGESPWYLRMLRDSSGAAQRMTQVLSNSRLATELFEKIPEAAAWFDRAEDLIPITEAELDLEIAATMARHESIDGAVNAVKQMRRRETLRIAMGAVLGDLTLDQVMLGLSDVTEAYLCAISDAVQKYEASAIAAKPLAEILDFGIIAMGRFGGAELGFGSDADVMFVYEPKSLDVAETAQKAAEKIVSAIRKYSQDVSLEFELDLDLRPEGTKGVIVRSLDSYRSYYERWASNWESQALLRARMISGGEGLVSDFTEIIDRYRYPAILNENVVVEIRRIKARVETERLPQGADPKRHLKLGRGSLSDVEWLVQLLQLRHGSEHPSIRTPKTLKALDACVAAGLIAAHDARVLSEAWTFSSRVRAAAVLWWGKRSDVLPVDRRQLDGMARILEYPPFSASALEQDYLAITRRSRAVFERIFFEWMPDGD
jgi:glutamate-ammonia-ligase adenylyltransferase